ncbi:MAG TPA: catalase family peroxidase [Rhodanobacteraceae bacterium]
MRISGAVANRVRQFVLPKVIAAACVAATGVAFAAAAPPVPQPTGVQVVNQFQKNGGTFPGYRRNHAKGVCISGYFQSNGDAARYSVAEVLAPGARTAFVGRLSIPGTNPYAWGSSTPIRGMALKFVQPNGQQWRTAMNGVPAFPVATPEANYQFLQDQQPLRATGDPNPQKMAAFFAAHPSANRFRIWGQTTPPSASFATVQYNSLDSFYLVDAHGQKYAVRWSMVPTLKADGQKPPDDNPNFLIDDLHARLARGLLRWHLVFTFAAPGDRIDDAAVAWPTDRKHVDAGTLVVDASHPQNTGVCRDMMFDPLVLPSGIEPSADPLLKARQEAYAVSHRRRVREVKAMERKAAERTGEATGG